MIRPLRVLMTLPTCWPDVHRGAERYLHELSASLVRLGHHVTILSTSPNPGCREVLGVPLVAFPASRPSVFAARCAAYAFRHRVDVWHAHSLYDAAAAAAFPRVRAVVTAHGPLERRTLAGRGRRIAFDVARRRAAWVCVSEAAAKRVREDWAMSPAVVPPGVDLSAWTPGGSRSIRPVVLYAGTLSSPRKNVPLLLDAAAYAIAREPDLEVWLAGAGGEPPLPAALAGHVKHLGLLDGHALQDAYRSAAVTALVSEREVFGMCLVESMATGTPCLVLDDGWGPAEIVDPGRTGERGGADPTALGEALLRSLALGQFPGTSAACREAAKAYDWDSVITPALVDLYLSLEGRPA